MPNTTARNKVFFDSSALFSGVFSSRGAARALLMLAEAGLIELYVSEQVITETENALARKAPAALTYYRHALKSTGFRILPDPTMEDVLNCAGLLEHKADIPILVAAIRGRVDYMVSLDQHFTSKAEFGKEGLPRIGSPGQVLHWLREDSLAPSN